MAFTLDNTLSGETSNSYCDLAYANSYFAASPNSAKRDTWAAFSDAQKTIVLIQACQMLEALKCTMPWETPPPLGVRMTYGQNWPRTSIWERYPAHMDQLLQFPRNIDYTMNTGVYYIPEPVMQAQCEQAYYLATLDESVLSDQLQGKRGDQITANSIELSTTYTGQGNAYAPMCIALMKPYLIRTRKLGRA